MATLPSAPASARASATAATSGRQDAVPRFGAWWHIMRSIGDMSLPLFFSSIHIGGASNVPSPTTPLIVCSNHSNTILDVAVLSSHFPHRRPLHFWAKAGFFKSPLTRWILTSAGNIKVDRRSKNNQTLFQGTFRAMRAGGAIALFPEGGSYTIPYLATLKMGAAWAALEYARYLELETGEGKQRTQVEILPTAVVFDDKSVFRSRAMLRFGRPIRLDAYIDEFLSAPAPSDDAAKAGREDGTVPATPESMTRSNTSTETRHTPAGVESYASPAHRAVARLTADLQRAIEALTFNAPDWTTFQAVRAAREMMFELDPTTDGMEAMHEGIDEYVDVSRHIMALLTEQSQASTAARQALFVYSCMLHLCDVDDLTLARVLRRSSGTGYTRAFWSVVRAVAIRLPLYVPVFGPTLVPMYVAPNAIAHHFARREEESLSSVKTLVGFVLTSALYATLVLKTLQWTRWSPPGLLVGVAAVWWLHDLNRSNIDTAYSLLKQLRLSWRLHRAASSAGLKPAERSAATEGRAMFFYGTLVHPRILARVIGSAGAHVRVQNAVLDGATLYHVRGEEYPGLLRTPSSAGERRAVKGTLVTGLTDADVRCLDVFEGDEYTRVRVRVIPDAEADVECNDRRMEKAGTAPLDEVLNTLTRERIEELCRTGSEVDGVEVYAWSAGSEKLTDAVWEFDVFARDKAASWIGEAGEAEHEHEYQLVDKVHASITTTSITSQPGERTKSSQDSNGSRGGEDGGGEVWESVVGRLTDDERVGGAIVRVCRQLGQKPSIQFFVDRAFDREHKRPLGSDPQLLSALVSARSHARTALETLISSHPDHEAITHLVAAKTRSLRTHHHPITPQWPFPATHFNSPPTTESKKSV